MTTIKFPWPPTTNNHLMAVRGRFILTDKARQWRRVVEQILLGVPQFGDSRVAVTMTFHCATRRRYDCSNLVKEIEDSLTRAGAWEDDSQVDELHIYRGNVAPHDGHVIVKIERIGTCAP